MKNVLLIALVSAGLLLGFVAWISRQNESRQRPAEARAKVSLQESATSSQEPSRIEQEATPGIKHPPDEDEPHHPDETMAPAGFGSESGDALAAPGKVLADADAAGGARQGQTNLGRAAIPALVQALQDRDAGMRSAAAAALGNLGAEAIPALIQALGEETGGALASHALAQIGVPALPQLIKALKEEKTRLLAFSTLCEIGLPAAPALIEATKSDDWSVRQLAELALQQILKSK